MGRESGGGTVQALGWWRPLRLATPTQSICHRATCANTTFPRGGENCGWASMSENRAVEPLFWAPAMTKWGKQAALPQAALKQQHWGSNGGLPPPDADHVQDVLLHANI